VGCAYAGSVISIVGDRTSLIVITADLFMSRKRSFPALTPCCSRIANPLSPSHVRCRRIDYAGDAVAIIRLHLHRMGREIDSWKMIQRI
jgi:hypothetical protein